MWKGGGKEKRREKGWERGEKEDKGKPGRSNWRRKEEKIYKVL